MEIRRQLCLAQTADYMFPAAGMAIRIDDNSVSLHSCQLAATGANLVVVVAAYPDSHIVNLVQAMQLPRVGVPST